MMNLEGSSHKEDESSTSTVALERLILASATQGTLKDAAENQLAPDEGWGQGRSAVTDLQSGGKRKYQSMLSATFPGSTLHFKEVRIHRTIQTKRTK